MTELALVSRSYLVARPTEAARVLGRLESDEAAAFLAALPPSIAAAPLAQMAPWKGARCLVAMAPASAAQLIARLPSTHRGRTMRAMPEARRAAVMAELPRRLARVLRRQLSYPASLVGAWMSGDVITLPGDTTAADAVAALQAREEPERVQLYVTDAAGTPLGVVAVAGALQAPPEQRLDALMRREIAPIPADAPLFRFDADRGWRGLLERPVIDARGHLVGALSLGQLAAARERSAADVAPQTSPMAWLAGDYFAAISGLARTVLALALRPGARHDR